MFDQNNDFSNTLEAILDLVVTKTAEVIFDAINEFFDPKNIHLDTWIPFLSEKLMILQIVVVFQR